MFRRTTVVLKLFIVLAVLIIPRCKKEYISKHYTGDFEFTVITISKLGLPNDTLVYSGSIKSLHGDRVEIKYIPPIHSSRQNSNNGSVKLSVSREGILWVRDKDPEVKAQIGGKFLDDNYLEFDYTNFSSTTDQHIIGVRK